MKYHSVIIHDRLDTYGGGERVVSQLSDVISGKTDVITGDYDPSSTYDFSHCNVIELGGYRFTPFIESRYKIDWKKYDFAILSGSRSQFVQWMKLPIPTIRYCHAPTRTFWSLRDVDFRNADLKSKINRLALAPIYRNIDKYLNRNNDIIIANSHNIRSQIERFYGLEASVVYPPVDVEEFSYSPHEDYWLSVSRLVPKKKIDIQLNAFENTDQNLVIVGSIDRDFPQYGEKIKSRAKLLSNVQIEFSVPQDRLTRLYSSAKGVVYTPMYEDFGIVPIEAMASGKPVVAAAEGGVVETMLDQQTGWLIAPTPSEIQQKITLEFESNEFKENCLSRSEKFGEERFKSEMREIIRGTTK